MLFNLDNKCRRLLHRHCKCLKNSQRKNTYTSFTNYNWKGWLTNILIFWLWWIERALMQNRKREIRNIAVWLWWIERVPTRNRKREIRNPAGGQKEPLHANPARKNRKLWWNVKGVAFLFLLTFKANIKLLMIPGKVSKNQREKMKQIRNFCLEKLEK